MKPALFGCRRRRQSLPNQLPGHCHTLMNDIVHHGCGGRALKDFVQVVLADIKPLRQPVQGKVLRQVKIEITQQPADKRALLLRI